MMERVRGLLKGNFWLIDVEKAKLSTTEIDFLSYFFDINLDYFYDEESLEEKKFLILRKKSKFTYH